MLLNINTKLIIEREAARESHPIPEIQLWGIWNDNISSDNLESNQESKSERVSFL